MNLKHFLRGLGTGIVFGALVMFVAFKMSGAVTLEDKEIMKRAEALGMVIGTEEVSETVELAEQETETTEDKIKEATTEKITEEKTTEATTEKTTEEKTTEKTTEKKDDGEVVKATITVTAGMGSTEVAKLLQDAGIIEDYLDFDNYLNQNGYSTQIRINTYTFTNKMTYKQIAEALIKEDKKN